MMVTCWLRDCQCLYVNWKLMGIVYISIEYTRIYLCFCLVMFLLASFMLWSDEIWKNQHHVYVAVPKTWTVVINSLSQIYWTKDEVSHSRRYASFLFILVDTALYVWIFLFITSELATLAELPSKTYVLKLCGWVTLLQVCDCWL